MSLCHLTPSLGMIHSRDLMLMNDHSQNMGENKWRA